MDDLVKDDGTMMGEEDSSISIEEDYTVLETEGVKVDDDSDLQDEVENIFSAASEYKDVIDETKAALVERIVAILEKGEITAEDNDAIAELQDKYTENYTALQTLAQDVTGDSKDSNESVNIGLDYDDLIKTLREKGDWLYIDEDGQLMLNGEAIPKLKLIELEAEKIKADLIETNELIANKATIDDLEATNANITNLKALVAEIQTLVGGNLTMDNIQSLVLTSDKVTIANALIKDAMIETVSANKINTGTINTNNVQIQSEDGSLLINGTTQQFKDKTGKVRIQIGKDAQGNFTFALFSQDGVGILIDETGIKSGAVPNGLIVDNMVSDNANISGGKLDISSVISSINNNENTLSSSKIKFDDTAQTLDVAFNQLKTKVETIENVTIDGDLSSVIEQVTTNTTNIGIMQGQISSLISNTTITKQDGTVVQLKDEFNSTKDTVNSHTQTINSLETNYDKVSGDISSVTAKQSQLEQSLDGFKTTVSSTYTTKEELDNLNIGTRNLLRNTDESKTLTGNSTENQCIDLYRISDPSLLAGKTATLSFKYTLSNWNGQGGIRPQTGSSAYGLFDQVWFWENGTFEYVSTITFSNGNTDTVLQLRADWLGGTVTILPNTAVLVISDKKADWTPAPEDVASSISTVEQTANKINWVVGSGTNQSNMTLTDRAYNLISNNITLTAEHINLDGYVSNSSDDPNWSVNTDGNMEVKNMNVEGELSTDVLNCNVINNPNYPGTISGNINLYVSNLTGSDDYTLDEVLASIDESEAQGSADLIKKFYSLRGVESALPKNLNGKTVRIYCETDDNGQVLFSNFTGGRILLFLCSHEIKGYLGAYNCYSEFKIYGGSDQSKPTTYGVIRPSTNTMYSSDNSSVYFQKSPVCGIYYCNVYGASTSSGYHCIKVTEDCKCRIDNCNFYSAYCFVTVSSVSDVYVVTTSGLAVDYAFKSHTGSFLTLANTSQANGKKGNAYWSNGSVIFGSLSQTIVGNYNIKWDSGSTVVENNTTTNKTTTATATYTSNYGDTYRSTVYNNWKKDNTCRQGDWGYGDCTGVWFFGTQFADLKGKTITKVTIKISRQSGGSSASVEHKLWMHNHATRPSGSPTLTSGWSQTFSLSTNNSTTITITNSTVLNAIKNGTCKGFAIRHSYDNSHYSVCSGATTVKITYQE